MTNRCNEIVETDCGPRRCGQNAWRDGLCKQHHPDAIEASKQRNGDRVQVFVGHIGGMRMPGASRNPLACTSGVGCGPEASKPVIISGNARDSVVSSKARKERDAEKRNHSMDGV